MPPSIFGRFILASVVIKYLFLISSTPRKKSKLLTIESTDVSYLYGKMSLPYVPMKDNFESEEVVEFLLNPPSYTICAETPSLCQSDAIFVIDRERLKHEEDIKSDDFLWRNNGTKTTSVKVEGKRYRFSKTYYLHGKYGKGFRRRIYSLKGRDGKQHRYYLFTYTFREEEHPVTPNKKKRTQPSTLQSIVAKLKEGKHTRDVYSETRSEAGGLRLIGSVSSFPKSLKQIQKLKERSQRKSDHLVATQTTKKDELFAIMLKCVEDKTGTKGSRFLQFVQGASQPLAFLADERQLKEVERFCTNPSDPANLSVDTTYNCEAFYVTPTTYRHKQVMSKSTGQHSGQHLSISIGMKKRLHTLPAP